MAQAFGYNNIPPLPKAPQSYEHYYHLGQAPQPISNRRKFNCDVCNKNFFTVNQLKLHIDDHVKCPFPTCNLEADFKVIDQHITNQHLLINFDSLQMDDEAWKKERIKRFPTKQRAELRRMQQMKRLNRGEKFSAESTKKGNKEQKKQRFQPNSNTLKNRGQKNNRHDNYSKNTKAETGDLYDSDPENKFGIKAFKGINSFYESTGELDCLYNSKADCELPGSLFISDDEEDSLKTVVPTSTKLHNALGSLMGAYATDSEEDDPPSVVDMKDFNANPPEQKENSVQENTTSKKRRRGHREKQPQKKFAISSTKPKPKKLRPPTLLEKLLSSEIKHERNVVLQCVRHIVSNNFFEELT